MNDNVCMRLLKPVCVCACVLTLWSFIFVRLLSSYLAEFTYIFLPIFGSTFITLGIVNLEFLWDF